MGSKYARVECERRFLLSQVPPEAHSGVEITDRYVEGTRLRLRQVRPRTGEVVWKLGQKVQRDAGDPRVVEHTTMYLAEDEQARLGGLRAHELAKTRFRLARDGIGWAVDVFHGPLEGLVLAEASFADEDAMATFVAPDWVGEEVSGDVRYSGGALAAASPEAARALVPTEAGRQDWAAWHDPYEDPESPLSQRLEVVRARVREALDDAPPGPVCVVSMCAGRGLDLIPMVADHPRRGDVSARLVELDPANVAGARAMVEELGLDAVEVVEADAAELGTYEGMVPAQVVLACGIFGNVVDDDVRHTVMSLPTLCAEGATVLWTRHRAEPDLTPRIRRWFAEAGFEELSFESPMDFFGVGAHRWPHEPAPFDARRRLFTFVR